MSSFLAVLAGEIGKVALATTDAVSQKTATHVKVGGAKKQGAESTCTPCAAYARVEAAKSFGKPAGAKGR